MNMTEDGLALIRRFEGFSAEAYRCPAGVWTIGYGHTAAAGPPAVADGMAVSREQAGDILRKDVVQFAKDVAASLRVPLNDRQFSALVSFAYNVGTTNFRKSSVLAAVNGGDLEAVPRRLQLWTKANGRVLPGLIKRRAAEAELFLGGANPDEARIDASVLASSEGKPAHRSTTILAAAVSALGGIAAALSGGAGRAVTIILVLIIAAGALWIVRERRRKAKEEGV